MVIMYALQILSKFLEYKRLIYRGRWRERGFISHLCQRGMLGRWGQSVRRGRTLIQGAGPQVRVALHRGTVCNWSCLVSLLVSVWKGSWGWPAQGQREIMPIPFVKSCFQLFSVPIWNHIGQFDMSFCLEIHKVSSKEWNLVS